MQGILGLIHLILVIIAIIDCVKSSRDTGKKVLWILEILFVPIVGPIIYLVVAKKK